jgi:P-type Cu+ transporter
LGVEGVVDGQAVVAGRPALRADRSIQHPAELQRAAAAGRDGRAGAVFAVADTAKPASAEAVSQLKVLGVRPALLAGDNAFTARTVAGEGRDQTFAAAPCTDYEHPPMAVGRDGKIPGLMVNGHCPVVRRSRNDVFGRQLTRISPQL